MKEVRVGIIGVGGMGSAHAHSILRGDVPRMKLTAVADAAAEKLTGYPDDVECYTDGNALIASDKVDAVVVATPHYSHTTLGIATLEAGKHLMVEKPISVHKADAERLIAAHKDKSVVFGAMFCLRPDLHYGKLRQLVQNGEIGELVRVNWIVTNWFRSQRYYDSGGWRATWKGEGGGVLLNQCPHNLDLLQWICGMPVAVRAFCGIGKRHNIEVEDEVTAYLEYANGATGVFITATGEAPGVNRLEICGDRGRILIEDGRVVFYRTEVSVEKFKNESPAMFGRPEVWTVEIPPAPGGGGQHTEIFINFIDAILDKAPLIAPGVEGIHSVELANAMLYSSMTESTIELPLDSAAFAAHLQQLIKNSAFVKAASSGATPADLGSSFNTNPA